MIEIHLPDDVEAQLRESVARADIGEATRILGDALPMMVETLMSEAAKPSTTSRPGRRTPEEMEALMDELADGIAKDMGDNVPDLSHEAFSREMIYEGYPKV